MDDKFLTLSEVLREEGYATRGIVSHTYVSSTLGFDQGFDSYDEDNAKGHLHISSPSITKKAISFLRANRGEPFFLFLHYFDPHFSYILHEDYNYYPDYSGLLHSGESYKELLEKAPRMSRNDIEYVKALYDSEISFTDAHIGRLLDRLKELGLYDNTLIVFTADHGEEFVERGGYYIGHGHTLYQEQIHVPLIIKFPGGSKQKVIENYVGLIDLLPSIIDYVGLTIPSEYRYEGNTIHVADGKALRSEVIISETRLKFARKATTQSVLTEGEKLIDSVERKATTQSVLRNGWKLIHDLEVNSKELFNLSKDTGESNNLVTENEKVSKALEGVLHKWRSHLELTEPRKEAEQAKFTPEEIERLKALGYVQ
jgi:arylsulfatase A-like enzyme